MGVVPITGGAESIGKLDILEHLVCSARPLGFGSGDFAVRGSAATWFPGAVLLPPRCKVPNDRPNETRAPASRHG